MLRLVSQDLNFFVESEIFTADPHARLCVRWMWVIISSDLDTVGRYRANADTEGYEVCTVGCCE